MIISSEGSMNLALGIIIVYPNLCNQTTLRVYSLTCVTSSTTQKLYVLTLNLCAGIKYDNIGLLNVSLVISVIERPTNMYCVRLVL